MERLHVKAVNHAGKVGLVERIHRKAVNYTGEAGLAEWETRLKASCELLQGLLQWGKLPVSCDSLLESGARVKQASHIVPSLTPPRQTAPQCSKEGCPALVNT